MAANRIQPLQVAAILLFIIGGFLSHAGTDPPTRECGGEYVWGFVDDRVGWHWEATTCETEPDALDELGYDFLEVTGLAKNTANTIGLGFFVLAFFCLMQYRQPQKNEEAEKLPESPTEETSPRSVEQVQQLYENLGLEPTKDTDETLPEPEADKNWWED